MSPVAFIGFGEAARTFVADPRWHGAASAFDRLTNNAAHRAAKLDDYRLAGVAGTESVSAAVVASDIVLSLVTANQSLPVAVDAAPHLRAGTLYFDMNSVAPVTKRAAAIAVEAAGARYVDVAIMAPVEPRRLGVSLLVSGSHVDAAMITLAAVGFGNIDVVPGGIGAASAVKMIRSVYVKGAEALTAECLIAAARAGVIDAVLASFGDEWPTRADYDLDRMLVHGTRRAAEMEEVVKTLTDLSVEPAMTHGTIRRQRAIGSRQFGTVIGLAAKLAKLAAVEDFAA